MTNCDYFNAMQCRSCAWLEQDYGQQLANKQAQSELALAAIYEQPPQWSPAQASAPVAMRNKAKMAVAGTLLQPSLGLAALGHAPVDLSECLLYSDELRSYFPLVKAFIGAAQIAPYDPQQRRGELKFVLLTQPWPDSALMLRLVLRSKEALDRIQKHLPTLLRQLPPDSVVSINLQPEHKAVLEGPSEILLSDRRWLEVAFNHRQLLFGTQSFLQTNSTVAAALYARAADWIDELDPNQALDLYCGVGAFAFHAASGDRKVVGVEISAEAIAAADAAIALNGDLRIEFRCGNAETALDDSNRNDLVIVNPPRRGLGAKLCHDLNRSGCPNLLYSSCNIDTLETDLRRLSNYRASKAQVFDMFPHTKHFEVLTLLEKY